MSESKVVFEMLGNLLRDDGSEGLTIGGIFSKPSWLVAAYIKDVSSRLATAESERDEAQRAKYGTPCKCEEWIEAARLAESERDALKAENERLFRDRYDALSVTSKEGLLSSEWIARTGKAEREAREARAEIERLSRELTEAKRAICWMHGYDVPGTEDFPLPMPGKHYNWRSVSRQQFAIVREACAEFDAAARGGLGGDGETNG